MSISYDAIIAIFHFHFFLSLSFNVQYANIYVIHTQKKSTPTKKNIINHVFILIPDLLAISIMLPKVLLSFTEVLWKVSPSWSIV